MRLPDGLPLLLGLPPHALSYPGFGRRGVNVRCPACGASSYSDIYGLALNLPDAQRFWRLHPRLLTVPEQPLETNGRAAWRVRFQSIPDSAGLDVLLAQADYAVLGVYCSHGSA